MWTYYLENEKNENEVERLLYIIFQDVIFEGHELKVENAKLRLKLLGENKILEKINNDSLIFCTA